MSCAQISFQTRLQGMRVHVRLFFHPLFGVNLSRAAPAGGVRDSVPLRADVCLMTEVPFMPACSHHPAATWSLLR